MEDIPEAVLNAITELKKGHNHHIEVHKRGEYYYLFETTSKWMAEAQARKKFSLYIGKVSSTGKLIQPIRKRDSTKGMRNLDEYMNTSNWEERERIRQHNEISLLKELSTNPRDSVSQISERLGLSYSVVYPWIKRLEEKYGIHYTIEHVFLNNFGFYRFFAVAKFTGKRPDPEALKKIIEGNKHMQLAFLTRGAYDLFIFFLAPDPVSAENMIYALRLEPVLADCSGIWYSSYFTQGMGYIPLREEFFDLLKERIWSRTKEQPRRKLGQIFLREFATLKELNSNGMADFSEIDKKYGLKKGSAQYTYHKLIEDNMIFRATLTMDKPPIKDTAVIMVTQIDIGKINARRREWLTDVIWEKDTPLNKYIFNGDVGSPYGVIRIAPIYNDGELEKLENNILNISKGIEIGSSIISKMLVGRLGYRKIDTTKTWTYEALSKENESQGSNPKSR
ncbi:transcriptional regulator, AsnC family [mine drainage metagenome]|uniref:Transcriptional regulator, AsnC family n=1 Tax=mine drainage metagenome TaxID=410659 RepID=T1A7N4_9ZZZZ